MRIREQAILIRTVSTEDATLAQAVIRADKGGGSSLALGYGPPGHEDEGVHAVAKRHPHDRPDPQLGEMLAAARAAQGVLDNLWAQVKERCPAIQTPSERTATTFYDLGLKRGREEEKAERAERMEAYAKAWEASQHKALAQARTIAARQKIQEERNEADRARRMAEAEAAMAESRQERLARLREAEKAARQDPGPIGTEPASTNVIRRPKPTQRRWGW